MPLSQGQQARYRQLVDTAYDEERTRHAADPDFPGKEDWRRKLNRDTTGKYSTKQMNNADFDKVMLELGIIAGDDYWIARASTNDVRQLRWILEKQFIPDLEMLEQKPCDWSYIAGICKQAGFPATMLDCPYPMLQCVLQMVDTHIRRLAKRAGIKLIDLPSGYFRKGIRPGDTARAMFRHDHHHHVHHGAAA